MAIGLALIAAIGPASAAPSTPGEVVQWASMRNNAILSQFPWNALQAATVAELEAVRDKANYDLDVVWYQANGYLEDILATDPDGLADQVATAEGKVLDEHNAAHAELESMYGDVVDSLPTSSTTTTTQPPGSSTTSTTSASTTSTTRAPTTTTRPTDGSTTTTSTTTTTTTTTTRPTVAIAPVADDPRPPPPSDPTQVGEPTAGAESLQRSDPVMQDDPAIEGGMIMDALAETAASGDLVVEDAGPVSGFIMAAAASVSLPPGLVHAAVSPFIVFEVLVGTLFESLESILLPLVILVAMSSIFIWRETHQARRASG